VKTRKAKKRNKQKDHKNKMESVVGILLILVKTLSFKLASKI